MNFTNFALKSCVVWLIVLSCHLSASADNLLPNSSFEEAGTGVPAADWNTYHCGYSRSDTVSLDGSWSCRITGTGSSEEIGLGGCNTGIVSGFPPAGKFIASSNIYISSYTQGTIYGVYVTVSYTDSTQQTFNAALSSADITANMNTWIKYSFTFSTNPNKTISSMVYWCLVWTNNGNKFIGTVYFDNVDLKIYKPALYYKGSSVASAGAQAAQDVLDRGYTHAAIYQGDTRAEWLSQAGFEVVKMIGPTVYNLSDTPRRYSPYNDLMRYDAAKAGLTSALTSVPGITGIFDDVEDPPFPAIRYEEDGTVSEHTFSDLEERIGNQTSQSQDWPIFKDWPVTGDHDVNSLTMENIEYNFPDLVLSNCSGTPDGSMIIGYYGPGFDYQSYEMAAQTFTPTDSRITRIDVMVKRYGSYYPNGNLYYYLTEVDANGQPDLTQKITLPSCQIYVAETNISATQSWNDIVPIPLYFDPYEVGELDTSKQYAIVLEFTKKDNNDWNGAFYYAGGFASDYYAGGEAWRRQYGQWVSTSLKDFWFKVYKPNPPTGYTLNQFHEDWIDFQCAVIARFVEDYRDIVDSVTPQRKIWVYSGYADGIYGHHTHNYSGETRRSYSVDWEVLAAAGLDYAVCGYGSQSITATVNALDDGNPSQPPKLIGGAYFSESTFFDRYANCDGVMFVYGGSYANDPGWTIP